MRNLSKFALSILSTLVVSSVLAQCPAGGPCPYQQSGGYGGGGYSGGYGDSYGGGYGGNYSYSAPNYDSSPGYGYSSGTRDRTARGHYRNVPPNYGSDNYDGSAPMYYQDQMGNPGYQGDMDMQGDMHGRPGAMRGMHGGMHGQPNQGSTYYDQSGSRGMYNPQGSSSAGSSQGAAQPASSTSSSTGANPSTAK